MGLGHTVGKDAMCSSESKGIRISMPFITLDIYGLYLWPLSDVCHLYDLHDVNMALSLV